MTKRVRRLTNDNYFIVDSPIPRLFRYSHDKQGAWRFELIDEIEGLVETLDKWPILTTVTYLTKT